MVIINLYSISRVRSSFLEKTLICLGLGQKTKQILKKEYTNVLNFLNGEIYSKIHFY